MPLLRLAESEIRVQQRLDQGYDVFLGGEYVEVRVLRKAHH